MPVDRKAADERTEAWGDIPDPIDQAIARPMARPGTASAPPREPSLTRSEVRLRRLVAMAACVLWPVVVVSAWGVRRGASDILDFLAEQTSLWTALVLLSAFTALARGRRGLGGKVAWMMLESVGIPALFVVLALFWLAPGFSGSAFDIGTAAQLRSCVGLGMLVVAPMLLFASWSLRRSFPSGAGWRGATAGASIGLTASIVLTVHCGITSGGHIALAHGAPILIAALAGALMASKLARA